MELELRGWIPSLLGSWVWVPAAVIIWEGPLPVALPAADLLEGLQAVGSVALGPADLLGGIQTVGSSVE